jgi:hypothetical protein
MHVTTLRASGSLNCFRRNTRRVCRTHCSYLASFTPGRGQDSASYKVRSETRGYRRAGAFGRTWLNKKADEHCLSCLRSGDVFGQSEAGGSWASRPVSACGSFAHATYSLVSRPERLSKRKLHIGLSGLVFRRANLVMFFFPLGSRARRKSTFRIIWPTDTLYVPNVQHTWTVAKHYFADFSGTRAQSSHRATHKQAQSCKSRCICAIRPAS